MDRTAAPSFEELAAQQGVTPVEDFEALLGGPLHEDESAEEFSARLRAWRREGSLPTGPE
jgi:hypothetical protein